MKEQDYINATNIAKVRAAKNLIRDLYADERMPVGEEEQSYVMRCLDAWEARLERVLSRETRKENKEPWRVVFPHIQRAKEQSGPANGKGEG